MRAFIPNPNLSRELAADPDVREGIARSAQLALAKRIAEAAAPRIMPRAGREHIEIVTDKEGVALVNTDHGGAIAEYGGSGVQSPVYAPLRRGALGAGLRLDEAPKKP